MFQQQSELAKSTFGTMMENSEVKMSRALKQNDLVELLKLYEAEFNQPDLHDKVLVFDVVEAVSWPRKLDATHSEEDLRSESEEGSSVTGTPTLPAANENEKAESIDTCIDTVKSDQGDSNGHKEASIDAVGETGERIKVTINESEDKHVETGKVTEENETVQIENEEVVKNSSNLAEIKTKDHGDESASPDVKCATIQSRNNSNKDSNGSEDEQMKTGTITDSERVETEKVDENSSEAAEVATKSGDCETTNVASDDQPTTSDLNREESDTMDSVGRAEIIRRQHRFYVHRTWLAIQSSYFRSLFFSGMRETNAKEVHIKISGDEEHSHLMLLEAMYKIDSLDKGDVDELLDVLRLAHKYDVKVVFQKCKYCLQAAVDSLEVCEKIMRFIKVDNTSITGVKDLAGTLQSFLVKEFSPLDKTWDTKSFEELCEPSVRYLLTSDELLVASENTVFHALMHWIEHRQATTSLLSVVRFEMIPIDYLYNIVQYNPIARKMANFHQHYLRGISYHALSDKMKQLLARQPVKRKAVTKDFIPYTWVIPRDELDELVGNDTSLHSDEFWFCGYLMGLIISQVVKPQQKARDNKEIFSAKLWLVIHNLRLHSVVEISWQPTSQSFTSSPSSFQTFTTRKQAAYVDVNYKIESKQKQLSTGFMFGGPHSTSRETSESSTPKFQKQVNPSPFLSICVKIQLC